jgi:hypothetical protein
MTPSVLEAHFPPSEDLWIGMAIRDICATASYGGKEEEEVQTNGTTTEETKKKKESKKPRGYTFAAVDPDRWLLPYTRVTVPSFDLLHDNHQNNVKQKSKQKGTCSNNTNHHVLVWTPHGRQKLTPQLYAEASQGLKSDFTLSLYDMPEESNNPKRNEKAKSRNIEWFQDLSTRRQNEVSNPPTGTTSTLLWSPILLPASDGEELPMSLDHVHDDNSSEVSGVALVGTWRAGLKKWLENLNTPQHVAILSTHSLSEILEIASGSVIDIIGTDLPTRWAKSKHAFAVDLKDTADETKRTKTEDTAETMTVEIDSDGCMDMNDKRYARDSKPLVPGCSCLACAEDKFSRAYIHHLVCAKELLAEMLLFGHNLHHLLALVRSFNTVDDSEALKEFIQRQLVS